MANWIRTEQGHAINLDMCTMVLRYDTEQWGSYLKVYFPGNAGEESCIEIRRYKAKSEADEFIDKLTGPTKKENAHDVQELAHILR